MNIAAIDADQYKDIGGRFGVQGFPTIKVFGAEKQKPTDYQGNRVAKAIVDSALSEARTLVKARLNGGSGSSSGKKKNKSSSNKKKKGSGGSGSVLTLTDYNFDDSIYNSDELWLVEFYAPWCGHCKQLAPEWEQAAKELRDSGVRLAALDATQHKAKAEQFGIKGFPTIKYFAPGSSSKSDAKEYQGGRTSADIVQYALQKLEKFGGRKLKIVELINQETLKSHCIAQDNSICIIAFLPHILDTQAKGRDKFLQEYSDGAKASRNTANFRFGWVQGGDQGVIESQLGLTFGFPVLVGINFKKQRFALQRGAFQAQPIKKFLNGLMTGKESTRPLAETLPAFVTVTAWDGKDPVMTEEASDEDMDDDILKELLDEKVEL